MRLKEKELTQKEEIEAVIREAETCFLGMTVADEPYVIPLNYGYRDNCLYFHCARKGRKIDMIKKNNRVSFALAVDARISTEGEMPCTWTTAYRSVAGSGEAHLVNDIEARREALDIIMSHYSSADDFKYKRSSLENVMIIKVVITDISCKKSG